MADSGKKKRLVTLVGLLIVLVLGALWLAGNVMQSSRGSRKEVQAQAGQPQSMIVKKLPAPAGSAANPAEGAEPAMVRKKFPQPPPAPEPPPSAVPAPEPPKAAEALPPAREEPPAETAPAAATVSPAPPPAGTPVAQAPPAAPRRRNLNPQNRPRGPEPSASPRRFPSCCPVAATGKTPWRRCPTTRRPG
jgi:cytoskeletal protein RodZ